jgi:type IV secretory pathway VirB4 component
MFGLNCAPELYHKIISQVLQSWEDVCNYLADIVVYGKSQAEHDARLDKVLQTFRDKGLTLKRKNC